MQFADRTEAGQRLAYDLKHYAGQSVVYALPRGGVVPGAEIARALVAPLDLIFVQKVGHPYDPEYAIGAVADNAVPVLNEVEARYLGKDWLERTVREDQQENARRRREYFPTDYVEPSARGKIAILTDDGMATGLSMQAAAKAVRERHPQKVVVAVPVASLQAIEGLRELADEVVVLDDPAGFWGAVGIHYRHFPQTTDREVVRILAEASTEQTKNL